MNLVMMLLFQQRLHSLQLMSLSLNLLSVNNRHVNHLRYQPMIHQWNLEDPNDATKVKQHADTHLDVQA